MKDVEILGPQTEDQAPMAVDFSSQAIVDGAEVEDINSSREPKMCADGVSVFYGEKRAIRVSISLSSALPPASSAGRSSVG